MQFNKNALAASCLQSCNKAASKQDQTLARQHKAPLFSPDPTHISKLVSHICNRCSLVLTLQRVCATPSSSPFAKMMLKRSVALPTKAARGSAVRAQAVADKKGEC